MIRKNRQFSDYFTTLTAGSGLGEILNYLFTPANVNIVSIMMEVSQEGVSRPLWLAKGGFSSLVCGLSTNNTFILAVIISLLCGDW